jgi:multidrug efflux pump subunit AcrA (membrane-fusion protein)
MLLMALVVAAIAVAATAVIPVTRWVNAEGYVVTDHEAEIRPSIEGAIDKWLVTDGQMVQEKQVLIQLKDAVHRAAYEQAQMELKVAQSELAKLKKDHELAESQRREEVFRARRELELLQDQLRRMEASKGGAVSQQEVSDQKLKVDIAKSKLAELELPREEVRKNEINVRAEHVEAARKAVEVCMKELDLRKIRAPLSGRVQLHDLEPGEVVKPEHVLGQVFDPSAWIVQLTVPERFIDYVVEGQPVRVELSAYPAWRNGYIFAKVQKVQRVVTARATGDGVVFVEARMDDPSDKKLHPGMSAQAQIDTGRTSYLRRLMGW